LASTIYDEIAAGEGLSLSQAARVFPNYRAGRPRTPSCLVRWIGRGVLVNGQRVHLEAARISGAWVTTRAAIARFVEAQTPQAEETDLPMRSARAVGKETSAAGERCLANGF
jgi:hypothetical protein